MAAFLDHKTYPYLNIVESCQVELELNNEYELSNEDNSLVTNSNSSSNSEFNSQLDKFAHESGFPKLSYI